MFDWSFALNTGAALLMGIVIGLERQWHQHPAGLRTNALVALGAALFVSLSLLMHDEGSPTRVASYVVSGLGFLGGGVILREGLNVKGLNTAATIWCSGAIGSLCGAGFVSHAALGTVVILFAHLCLRPLSQWIDIRLKKAVNVETLYRMRVVCPRQSAPETRMYGRNGQPNIANDLPSPAGRGRSATVCAVTGGSRQPPGHTLPSADCRHARRDW